MTWDPTSTWTLSPLSLERDGPKESGSSFTGNQWLNLPIVKFDEFGETRYDRATITVDV